MPTLVVGMPQARKDIITQILRVKDTYEIPLFIVFTACGHNGQFHLSRRTGPG